MNPIQVKPEERPTPESSANAFVATKEFMPSKGVLVVPIETAQRLERERDRLLEALEKAVMRQGFTNDELIDARAAIAEVKGAK